MDGYAHFLACGLGGVCVCVCGCLYTDTLAYLSKKCIRIRGKEQMYFGNKDWDDRMERITNVRTQTFTYK